MTELWVEAIGFIGVSLYAIRWYFQIKASRKAKRSVTPIEYWVLSFFAQATTVLYTYLLGSIVFPLFLAVSICLQAYNIKLELNNRKVSHSVNDTKE